MTRPVLQARRKEAQLRGEDPDLLNPTHLPPPELNSPSLHAVEHARKDVGQIARTLGEDIKMMEKLDTPYGRKRFIYDYFGYWQMEFHQDMLDCAWHGGFWDVMVATEHGKSTTYNVHFPLLSLARDP